MKRFILFFVVSLFIGAFISNAQTNNTQPNLQEQAKNIMLKPTFKVDDLAFALNTMATIELVGSEVDPFLVAKKYLVETLTLAKKANKEATDNFQVELPLNTAQNIVNLMARAKISGQQADQYKRFTDAIIESAKALQNQDGGKK